MHYTGTMKTFLMVALFALLAQTAHAQTNAVVTWNQTEPPATAGAFLYTLKVDSLAPAPLTAACVTATAPATGSACSAPFALANPTSIHTYVLVAANNFGSASMTLGPGAVPGSSGIRVQVTVVVTVP